MTLLELLEASDAPVITDLIAATSAQPAVGKFDNRPTWDNANAAPAFDLGSMQWSDSKLSRVVFRDCKLMGATLTGLTLDNVLFEGCKLDFAAFTRIRASGPTVFSKCTLTEATFAGCDLNRAVLDDCTLRRTEFEHGSYRELDLRGNDLSELRGAGNLAKVIIDRGQEAELARALVTELEAVFGDDLDDPASARRR
ncbi:multiple cyclophane-containing RiPP AmcA [Kitasatospora sp. NPDC056446]|uniref:multiple cyclophane-containing RiPP AmcA n=1 Tax=Kitasatospora sp. NPDC056446 TaxID=3345819 RepID=UPI003686AAD8